MQHAASQSKDTEFDKKFESAYTHTAHTHTHTQDYTSGKNL